MKPIKMFGLTAVAALMATAFVGVSSAMAEATVLCKVDELKCDEENVVTYVHEESLGEMKLLSSPTVECNILFSGDAFELGSPLIIVGTFTYTNCNDSCTLKQVGSAFVIVLREGEHLAAVTFDLLVEMNCFLISKCSITMVGVEGHGLDPLTAAGTHGKITISGKEVKIEKGNCPAKMFLDITTEPLENIYISE